MNEQRPVVDLKASCACGAVHLHISGKIRSTFLCACRECQKATGTGHSAVAIANSADVSIVGDTNSFARPADSGATLTRHFCPLCATTLVAESSRWPGASLLPAGLFEDQSWFIPGQVLFNRSHQHWDILPGDIPHHATYRED